VSGCDLGPSHDVPNVGPAPIHLVGENVGLTTAYVRGHPIELAFDRLLNPSLLLRQTFELRDLNGNFLEPAVAYDPVARVVRICPPDLPQDRYLINITTPANSQSTGGLRAIDGATLDPTQDPNLCQPYAAINGVCVVEFPVASGAAYAGADACPGGGGSSAAVPPIDFCREVMPIFQSKCGGGACHAGPLPAAGLSMVTPALLRATALDRVAQGSNTGTRSAAEPQSNTFGVDMPIVDTGNAPGDSWLVYKLLLASPPACSSTPGATCDAGTPGVVNNRLAVSWNILSDSERQTLSDWVPGREMPFPTDPTLPLGNAPEALTADEMETVSLWILQGAAVPDCP
jgi:hypothetical protein